MIIEFLKEEKCNEMFNLIKDCFNLEVNDNNIKEIIKSENEHQFYFLQIGI